MLLFGLCAHFGLLDKCLGGSHMLGRVATSLILGLVRLLTALVGVHLYERRKERRKEIGER